MMYDAQGTHYLDEQNFSNIYICISGRSSEHLWIIAPVLAKLIIKVDDQSLVISNLL